MKTDTFVDKKINKIILDNLRKKMIKVGLEYYRSRRLKKGTARLHVGELQQGLRSLSAPKMNEAIDDITDEIGQYLRAIIVAETYGDIEGKK